MGGNQLPLMHAKEGLQCEMLNRYTWTNNRTGHEAIWEGLDKTYCNTQWLDFHPQVEVLNLPIIKLDHGMMIISTNKINVFARRSHRFEAMWLQDPSCKSIIKQAWTNEIQ
ncbi:hypothetical protein J1N35_025756, partial [Gossypium stocksii]